MLIGALVGVAVVLVVALAAFALRRRSHDDVHSVEHYHHQLHTLEDMRAHQSGPDGQHPRNGEAPFPASAVRVSGSSTVRLTEPGHTVVPPVPPPPVPNADEAVTFDDADVGPDRPPGSFMTGSGDRALHSINHRPRRLAGPLAAVGVVALLVVVLIVTGLHTSAPSHRHGRSSAPSTAAHTAQSTAPHTPHTAPPAGGRHGARTTTTTSPPAVSAPVASSAHAVTYRVAAADYALVLSATTGECWVEATSTTSGTVLYTATLFPGQSHTVDASGAVTVVAGATGAFAATVDGAQVVLPAGALAPVTLSFEAGPTA